MQIQMYDLANSEEKINVFLWNKMKSCKRGELKSQLKRNKKNSSRWEEKNLSMCIIFMHVVISNLSNFSKPCKRIESITERVQILFLHLCCSCSGELQMLLPRNINLQYTNLDLLFSYVYWILLGSNRDQLNWIL